MAEGEEEEEEGKEDEEIRAFCKHDKNKPWKQCTNSNKQCTYMPMYLERHIRALSGDGICSRVRWHI